MKKLIVISVMLFLIAMVDVFYICYNEVEVTSNATKSKEAKEVVSNKSTIKTNNDDNSDCTSLYSYEVAKVDTNYLIESSEDNVLNESYDSSLVDVVLEDEIIMVENSEEVEEDETLETDCQITDEITDDEAILDDVKTDDISDDIIINDTALDNEVSILNDESLVTLKNGFYEEDDATYYYENDIRVTGLKNIDGVNHYFSPSGKYLGTTKIKVIDVSYYQGDINWDEFANESDCYGVILRLGYYDTLDKKFKDNISEIKRLNIPYGIYLFSYSTTITGALKEANFTNQMIDEFDLEPTLGIYYDIESWSSSNGASSDDISKDLYDKIVETYVNTVSNHVNNLYKVKVYSGRWYAMNRLGSISKSYVDWVAEYNSTLNYDGAYSMWQYTSKGSVPGITGNVDISYLY